jgi:hypothetical protein
MSTYSLKVQRLSTTIVVGAALLGLSSAAHARRMSNRDGFNFGTNVRLMDSDNHAGPTSTSDTTTRTINNTQSFTPYMGYAFGDFNLGLVCNLESYEEQLEETKASTNERINRESKVGTKSASLFARFNFGKVMFMEGGFGAYSQTIDTHTEYRLVSETGTFTGRSEDQTSSGVGPGYHVGGGIELPIDNGFFFTAAYMVRSFSLRDQSSSELGTKIGSQQKRELSFGISYYD